MAPSGKHNVFCHGMEMRGSRSWQQTTKHVYEQQRGEKGFAARAAITLQTMQDLSGTLAHNIVLPYC